MNDTINIDDAIQTINKQNKRIEELVNINEKISLSLESAEKKLDQYKNNWEELKKWVKTNDDEHQPYYGTYDYNGEYEDVLDKMKELEKNN